MSEENEIPSRVAYMASVVAAIIAVIGLVLALSGGGASDRIVAVQKSLSDISASADDAKAVALERGDFEFCVASDVTSAVALAVIDSLDGLAADECRIPEVAIDVSDCIESGGKANQGLDVPAAVESVIAPIIATVKGLIGPEEGDLTKAWVVGVVEWIESGKDSVIDLIEDPASGELRLKSVVIKGCVPSK